MWAGDRRRQVRERIQPFVDAYSTHRYAILFYTLLLTLVAAPTLTALRVNPAALQVILGFNLLVALLDVTGAWWRLPLMLLVVLTTVGLRLVPTSEIGVEVSTAALMAGCAVAMVAAASAVRFALHGVIVTAERLYAALSAYLMVGLFFGLLHWTVHRAWPGSFGEAGAGSAPIELSLASAMYFSFVTLATLGYGDIVPKTELARGLTVLEAIGGQLYVAVLIARLVGAHLAPPTPGDSDGRRGDREPRRPDP